MPDADYAADFAGIHAGHVAAVARANGKAIPPDRPLYAANAFAYDGASFGVGSISLVLLRAGAQVYKGHYDPHALQALRPVPLDAELTEAAAKCASTGATLMARTTQHLTVFAPLPYGPACVACHAPEAQLPAVWLYDLPEIADD